ncbi:AzlC family ABC transporter permease [Celerinatantimonas sp. YJH-8]|uniref:AzlC family ABC transporter permease n=1 Tax=Celerinatantimonas sp. YJH-8 TaxID=3228714 RepID=UPI0038C4867C
MHTLKPAFKASLPIVIGYLPIAFAFGMTGVVNGLPIELILAMSAFIYAGASQFILLAAIHTGTYWPLIIGLCALMDIRHFLYGTVLMSKLPDGFKQKLGFAFLLTDEVFATALVKISQHPKSDRLNWACWLGGISYLTWFIGTTLGALAGVSLSAKIPLLTTVMPFALPALFIVLVYESLTPFTRLPMLVSALVAAILYLQGMTALALLGGALSGCVITLIRSKFTHAVI